MFVRLKIGRRAGEVHEMKFSDAQPLLADGRAEQVYQEPPPPAVAAANGQSKAPETKPGPAKKRKSDKR